MQRIPPREIERIRHVLGIETKQRAALRDAVKPSPAVKRRRGRPRKHRPEAEATEHA